MHLFRYGGPVVLVGGTYENPILDHFFGFNMERVVYCYAFVRSAKKH